MQQSESPLEDVRVVSLALNVPGPVAARELQNYGATVTKVEPPAGDPLFSHSKEWYEDLSSGQKVVTLDLKDGADREEMEELLAGCDVLLTSSRRAALERLGLGWDGLHERHPRLCQVEIVGSPTPRENEPGHDLTYMADFGLLDPPNMPGTLMADLAGAERAVSAAMALLIGRDRTGKSRRVEVSLEESARLFARPSEYGLTRPGAVLGGGFPGYALYEASDGVWLAVACLEGHFMRRLLEELDLSEDATTEDVGRTLGEKTSSHWLRRAARLDLPIRPVQRPDDGTNKKKQRSNR